MVGRSSGTGANSCGGLTVSPWPIGTWYKRFKQTDGQTPEEWRRGLATTMGPQGHLLLGFEIRGHHKII